MSITLSEGKQYFKQRQANPTVFYTHKDGVIAPQDNGA